MKFMYFFLPTIPATMDERRALRPIAMHPDRWQRMIEEVVEISQLAEDVGFDAVCFPEHHLHSEGIEMGSLPVLTQHPGDLLVAAFTVDVQGGTWTQDAQMVSRANIPSSGGGPTSGVHLLDRKSVV